MSEQNRMTAKEYIISLHKNSPDLLSPNTGRGLNQSPQRGLDMSNIHNSTIYEKGISLSETERAIIRERKMSVSRIMAVILKNRPGTGLNYGEMIVLLEKETKQRWSKDTVAGRLSEMTGAQGADESMKDLYGRWPLVKLDEKRKNPLSQHEIHLYAWNKRYGKPPSHRELVSKQKETGQMNFHQWLFEGAV